MEQVTRPLDLGPQLLSSENLSVMAEVERAIQISETRYRRLFETTQDGILLLNAETEQINDVNPFLLNMLGYKHEEFKGKVIWEIAAFEALSKSQTDFRKLYEIHFIRYDDLPLIAKDGTKFSVELICKFYDYDGINVIQCYIRDNTKRHLAEIALIATTRAHKFLSECNVALLKAKTESILLAEYCRIAVETGGYQMAWIGVADETDNKNIKSLSYFDLSSVDLEAVKWAEGYQGDGATGRAIRSGQVQFVGNIAEDSTMLPWRDDALKCGYQSVIAIPFELLDETTACITLYSSKIQNWSAQELHLLEEITADLAFGISALQTAASKVRYQNNLRESLEQTIQVIADTAEERDPYTAGHQRGVADLCTQIALTLGLSADRIHGLHLAASIHDLGKISIPAEILAKPRRLSVAEFALIKEHPMIGYNILKKVNFPWEIAKIILQHHERIDGSGYPSGLKGDKILLESKILGVADVVEAMASHRPYRAALGIDAALNEMKEKCGKAFDPDVVDACLRVFNEQGFILRNWHGSA